MGMRDRLLRLSLLKLIADEVKANESADKTALMKELGGRMGATAAVLDNGDEVGTVSISAGKSAKLQVVNPAQWAEHVKKVRPTAIIESVRDSDTTSLLAEAAKNGEVPPGCAWSEPGSPYVIVNQSEEQKRNAIEAWRRGEVELPTPAWAQIEGSDEHP